MRIKIFNKYEKCVRSPLLKKKNEHIKKLGERHDFDNMLVLNDQDEKEIAAFRM